MRPRNILALAFAAALALPALPALRAADDPKQAQLEKQLAAAQKQLEESAKKVAELSKQLAQDNKQFSKDMKKYKTYTFYAQGRPRIGVIVNTDQNDATDPKGALIQGVTPGGPAAEAGLKADDVITRFNGQKLAGPYPEADEDESAPGVRLVDLARELKEGQKVPVEYLRGKETRTTTLTPRVMKDKDLMWFGEDGGDFDIEIPELPEIPEIPEDFISLSVNLPHGWSDMELVALNPELGEYFGTSEGLLVVESPKESSLQLKPGDVLLKIGDRKAISPSQAYRVLRSYEPGESVNVEIVRKQKHQTLAVKVPERKSGKGTRHREVVPLPPEAPAPPAAPAPRAFVPSGSDGASA